MGSPFTTIIERGSGITMRAASPSSKNYLRHLMLEKAAAQGGDVAVAEDKIERWLANRSQREVSENIDRLKAEGYAGRGTSSVSHANAPSAEVVPAGRYAIETEDAATNGLAFYKVDRPTEGRWTGHVFVKLMISDDEQRLSWATAKSVLAKIAAAGAEAASARYGHEIGECGICGRTLTNDVSRARGIGPVCAEKMGW